jgi:dTDP-4-amino-4,6-dideoxygalactose transaminase
MEFRDLKQQYQVLKKEIDEAVGRVMSDSNFISGSQVRELEEKLAEYVGVKHCITCANGTDALELALMTWGVGRGDAVFVPSFTFMSNAEAAASLGAYPVFVDIDRDTFNIDAKKLEEAIIRIKKEGKSTRRL